jgi:hypothetical protein
MGSIEPFSAPVVGDGKGSEQVFRTRYQASEFHHYPIIARSPSCLRAMSRSSRLMPWRCCLMDGMSEDQLIELLMLRRGAAQRKAN